MISIARKGTALVTGAASGIGAAYAHQLALRGYDLILVDARSGRLDEFAGWLGRDTGRSIEIMIADLTTAPGIDAVEDLLILDDRLTMLVINASAAAAASPAFPGFSSVADLIGYNVGIPARLAHAAAGSFAERKRGSIVTLAPRVVPATAALPGTEDGGRALLLELARSLTDDLSTQGVAVQLVLPDRAANALWDLAGAPVEELGEEILLLALAMADHGLALLDRNVAIARPALPHIDDWGRFARAAASSPFASFARPALVELA